MSPSVTQRTHSIATMGADGIGPEVVNAGVQVLRKLAELDGTFKLQFTDYDWSSETYKTTGQYIPDGGLEQLKKHDAILFGAVGAPGTFVFLRCKCAVLMTSRCTRSHLFMGSTTSHLPNLPAIRECPSHQDLPRNFITAAQCRTRRLRLGHRARELRR
jgi:hypothetical protein